MPDVRFAVPFALTCLICIPACGGGGDGDDGEDASAPIPATPEVSDTIFTLGQALFFDRVLSGNRDISCATCHHPRLGTDDDLALSRGVGATGLGVERVGGFVIPRNAPALFNIHQYESMFWDSRVRFDDGRLQTPAGAQLDEGMEETRAFGIVAAQALFPVASREEMRGEPGSNELAALEDGEFTAIWRGLMLRLGAIPEYVTLFEAAYPGVAFGDMTFAHAANAIAGFEIRAFERRATAYQRFLEGDEAALSGRALEGMDDFFDAGCGRCHQGPLLSDFDHHNTALAQFGPGQGHGAQGNDDFGREGVTGDPGDRYAFRTTPLVNITLTGPFGHAGQFATLHDFVDHYRNPQQSLRNYDIRENVADATLWPTLVSNQEAILDDVSRRVRNLRRFNTDDIVAFLEAASTRDDALSNVVPESVPSGLPVD